MVSFGESSLSSISAQKPDLDRAEGLGHGYEEKRVILKDSTGQTYEASMYFASQTHKNADLRPYSWYLGFVVEGAKQHGKHILQEVLSKKH
jgi:gamma-glutamylcyclotransferase